MSTKPHATACHKPDGSAGAAGMSRSPLTAFPRHSRKIARMGMWQSRMSMHNGVRDMLGDAPSPAVLEFPSQGKS